MRQSMAFTLRCLSVAAVLGVGLAGAQAATVMQQCSQQYQAAKAGGTLNGMSWNQFRSDCSAKLKTEPASAPAPAAPAAPATPATTTPVSNPLKPAAPAAAPAPTTTANAPAPSATPAGAPAAATGGRAAFYVREKQCGSEWRTNKATLVAQTPGLTWPKYLSQCNARLKAAGK